MLHARVAGPVSPEEVDSLQPAEDEAAEDTRFTSGYHFYQQVEQGRGSAWLVVVMVGDGDDDDDDDDGGSSHGGGGGGGGGGGAAASWPLADKTWLALRQRVGRLGVRTGVLDCRLDSK